MQEIRYDAKRGEREYGNDKITTKALGPFVKQWRINGFAGGETISVHNNLFNLSIQMCLCINPLLGGAQSRHLRRSPYRARIDIYLHKDRKILKHFNG